MSANKTKGPKGLETANPVKMLFLDVEVSANLGWVWNKYEQDVLEFESEKQIISFAWSWLGEKQVHVMALPDFPGYKRNPQSNKALVGAIHKLVSAADIAVGHNIDGYDDKVLNTDFALNHLGPPSPHKTVDTLKVIRSKFKLNSNKLADACKRFKLKHKLSTGGFKLWLGCMRGDPKSWAKMKRYNAGDIVALKDLYFFVRPWMTNHPSVAVLKGSPGCPTCGSSKLIFRGKRLVGGVIRRGFSCKSCGAWPWGIFTRGAWKFK